MSGRLPELKPRFPTIQLGAQNVALGSRGREELIKGDALVERFECQAQGVIASPDRNVRHTPHDGRSCRVAVHDCVANPAQSIQRDRVLCLVRPCNPQVVGSVSHSFHEPSESFALDACREQIVPSTSVVMSIPE